jgi:hypothetical protein
MAVSTKQVRDTNISRSKDRHATKRLIHQHEVMLVNDIDREK